MNPSFTGIVIAPGLQGPRPTQVVLAADGAHAQGPDGAPILCPYLGATLELGGSSGKMVFMRAPSPSGGAVVIGVEDPGFLDALAAYSRGVLEVEITRMRGAHTSLARKNRVAWLALPLFLAVVGAFLWFLPDLVSVAVTRLPLAIDRQVGDAAMLTGGLGAGEEARSPLLERAIAEMIKRLEPHAAVRGFEYRVKIVRSDDVNAFALPGGQIVVFTGLIEKASRPEQVAGVLAHEIAHVTMRHGLSGLAKQAGLVLAVRLLIGDPGGLDALVAEGAMSAALNGYSRDQEREADEEGVRMMRAAGLDPRGLAEFFQELKKLPGSELPGLASWMSTHPEHDERIANVRALAGNTPTSPPLPLEWEEVRRAAAGEKPEGFLPSID